MPPTRPVISWRSLATPVSRAVAGFLGGFTLLNLVGDLFVSGFDSNFWWINLHPLPGPMARVLLIVAAGLFLAYAARPAQSLWRRRATAGAAAILSVFAGWNAVGFFALLIRGRLHSGFPIPLSLLILATLLLVLRQSLQPTPLTHSPPAARAAGRIAFVAALLACAVGFPLVQMLCFGLTDYRDYRGRQRPADAIVVFGARTYADGTPSQALVDRVRTACDLYRQGYADKVIFSGGPGDGAVNEPEAMRRLALASGVPDAAIYLDPSGLNTDATVRNTRPLFERWHARHVLAVSHAYHLPRVKMAYRRQGRDAFEVYTVPAHETRPLRQMPFLICREVAALWAYYLRPLGG